MTSIPLLCNICPKEPDFSDISHLLTHVASKGHLAQELKAKVRGRQDASIRDKLDAYDRWYAKHQIERLLSQRLILKESKDTSSRVKRSANSPATRSVKTVKPRKRRAKTSEKVTEASPVKYKEPAIDPQLSWYPPSSPSPFLGLAGQGGLPQYDQQAFSHRFHVPRMCEEYDANAARREAIASTPSKTSLSQKALPGPGPDTDSENDYFDKFIRSPTRTAYPDPTELLDLPFSFSPPRTIEHARERASSTPDLNDRKIEKTELMQQLPILKGVKWPGMSIFDSASLEAQRLRNQKKDGSILEQMEYNSGAVEQVERIYWPDGSLKQERLITGNVESSPLKEPTPLPKRQRTKAKKSVLTDISTNAPKPTRRARKTLGQISATQASDLRSISEKALATLDPPPPKCAHPRSAHMGLDTASEEDLERRLTRGIVGNGRSQAFDVFKDDMTIGRPESTISGTRPAKLSASREGYPFLHNSHGHQGHSQPQAADFTASRSPFAVLTSSAGNQKRVPSDGLPWDTQSRPFADVSKPTSVEENSENIEPILDGDGRVDDQASQAHNERITQRYFSVTGNQPPQFFNSLPPHMDFGGLGESRYHGSTLNLLNPYLRQQHLPPQYPPVLYHHPAPSFFATRQDDVGKSGRPACVKDE